MTQEIINGEWQSFLKKFFIPFLILFSLSTLGIITDKAIFQSFVTSEESYQILRAVFNIFHLYFAYIFASAAYSFTSSRWAYLSFLLGFPIPIFIAAFTGLNIILAFLPGFLVILIFKKIAERRLSEKQFSHLTEKRLGGLTATEQSQLMRDVRLSPEQKKIADKMAQEMVDNLNKNVPAE